MKGIIRSKGRRFSKAEEEFAVRLIKVLGRRAGAAKGAEYSHHNLTVFFNSMEARDEFHEALFGLEAVSKTE